VLAHYVDGGLVRCEGLLRAGLEYCQDTVLSYGFDLTFIDDIARQMDRHEKCQMLVAGCQDRPILYRRVRAAHHTVEGFRSHPFTVIFSGLNPDPTGATPARTANESREMNEYFRRLTDEGDEARAPITIDEIDEAARDTKTNIREFVERFAKGDDLTTLFVVSSTAHLIRLVPELLTELGQGDLRYREVILVGAEPTSTTDAEAVPSETRYVKMLMYEVLADALHRSSPAAPE
jgi:hypothetical protein